MPKETMKIPTSGQDGIIGTRFTLPPETIKNKQKNQWFSRHWMFR